MKTGGEVSPRDIDLGDEEEDDSSASKDSELERSERFLGSKSQPSQKDEVKNSSHNGDRINPALSSSKTSPSRLKERRLSFQGLASFSLGPLRDAASAMLDRQEIVQGVYNVSEKGIIHPYSSMRIRWDVLIGMIVLIQCFTIPFRVSFQISSSPNEAAFWIDRIIDMIFIFDVYLNFRTGYLKDDSLVELQPEKVRWNYFKTMFLPDLVASIPYEIFVVIVYHINEDKSAQIEGKPTIYRAPQLLKSFRILRIFKIVKLLRLLRLLKIMARWESALYIRHSMASITRFFAFVIFVAHWGACSFHAVAVETVIDGPPNWILYYDMQDKPDFDRYIMAFYWSVSTVTTIGYGDIVPHSISERVVAVIAMIVGCCVFAYGITNILEMVSHINKSDKEFRERMDDMNQYMRYRGLPADLRYRVREYIQHTRTGQHEFMSEANILKQLSPTIRYDVIKFVNRSIIEAVPVFQSSDPAFVVELTKVLKAEYFAPGDKIVVEGQPGRKMYILAKGMVEIIKWDTFRVDVLLQSSYFGEMALLSEGTELPRRSATVRALTYCDVRSITNVDFKLIVENFPDVLERMMRVVKERAEDLKRKEHAFSDQKPKAKKIWFKDQVHRHDKYLWTTRKSPSSSEPNTPNTPIKHAPKAEGMGAAAMAETALSKGVGSRIGGGGGMSLSKRPTGIQTDMKNSDSMHLYNMEIKLNRIMQLLSSSKLSLGE